MKNYYITWINAIKDDNEYNIAIGKQRIGAVIIEKLLGLGYKWLDRPYGSYRQTDILIIKPKGKLMMICDRLIKHYIEDHNNCKYETQGCSETYIEVGGVGELLVLAK